MLLSAGVPLLEALRIMQNMSSRSNIQKIIDKLADGHSLAAALEGLFPSMLTVAIEGAERAGSLEATLERLAKHFERQAETEEKIKSVLVYPVFIFVLSLVSVAVLMIFVLPSFKGLFADLGQDLPLFSKLIINAGDAFAQFWYLACVFPTMIGLALFRYKNTPRQRQTIDALLLKLKFVARVHMIDAFRTLGTLLAGGVPIRSALKTVEHAERNTVFKDILRSVRKMVENGESLSNAFSQHTAFPSEAIKMLAVGESSGKLDQMLLHVANYYENEREVLIKRCVSLLEPALTLFIGLLVGLIAIALFLPMLNVISGIQ